MVLEILGIAIGLLCVIGLLAYHSFFKVNEGYVATIESFSKPLLDPQGQLQVFKSGLHMKKPWAKVNCISTMEQLVDLNQVHAIASDGTNVLLDVKVRFQVDVAQLYSYVYGAHAPLDHIKNLFVCLIRNEVANFCSDDEGTSIVALRQRRSMLNEHINKTCNNVFRLRYGIVFKSMDIVRIGPPAELETSLNAVQNAKAEATETLWRAQSQCAQMLATAEENVRIAEQHASATETEIKTLGRALSSLKQSNTLAAYVERRKTEVTAASKLVFIKN